MRPTFKELKRNAREILFGKYSILILAYLLVELISVLLFSVFLPSSATASPVQTAIYYLANFIISILTTVLSAGLIKMIMNLVRKEPVRTGLVFFAFRSQADRFIIASVLLSVMEMVPLLLPKVYCMVSGYDPAVIGTDLTQPLLYTLFVFIALVLILVIKLPFAFVFPILLDDIYCGAIEAFRRSFAMLRGNCLRLLALYLSFVGWYLLGILSFGIGLLWVNPYLQTTFILFYFSLSGTGAETKDTDEPSENNIDDSNRYY